ncbi:MAG: acyl-ACP--UDP-N-acetylglucosamine O-acyltransferase [Opitutales bacterium]|nr:acyl-ACP--UDP-N-acetylglucosamine O-acyltransferase [Opitutales bacterium]MCH8541607.1 acyl-ACP--UDP-N-acetylglucosamine O-acyltransferase [Opitutales bacterium]
MSIHETALVPASVVLGKDARIGPFSLVEEGVVVGEQVTLHSHVVVHRGTVLGKAVELYPQAVVGGDPQDLGFDRKLESGVVLGAETILREGVTIHRSTQPGHNTFIGARAYLMAGSHVGHDCQVGDGVILANDALLAGFVTLGENTFVGGGAAFHQFVRVGAGAMISGHASITRDVPPYCMAAERDRLVGLNLVGLRRQGASREEIRELKSLLAEFAANHQSFREGAAARLEKEKWKPGTRAHTFVSFFQESRRGIMPVARTAR